MCETCDAREREAEKAYEVGDNLIARLDESAAWEKRGYRHDLLKDARDQLVRLATAARLIDEFAWSSCKPDCVEAGDEANRRILCLRAALRGEDFIKDRADG